MHKKRMFTLLILSMLLVLMTACGKEKSSDPGSANNSKGSEIKVGFAVPDSTNPFFIQMTDIIKEGLAKENITLQVSSADMDMNKQINTIENFVASKVDVLIVAPVDDRGVEPALKAARDAGVKVISFGGDLTNTDVNILADQAGIGMALGEDAAKWINEQLGGTAEVGVIVTTQTNNVAVRAKTLEESLKAGAPNAKLVAKQEATTVAEAQQVAENMIQAYPNIKVIATNSDAVALGAFEAVSAAGKASDDFYINGSDATPEAIQKIKDNGILRVTLDMGIMNIPDMTVEAAIKLAKGEQVERIQYASLTLVDSTNVSNY